jgi:Family of unknown function (DUF6084)
VSPGERAITPAETTGNGAPPAPDRPEVEFAVVGVAALERSAAPTLSFTVEAGESTGRRVYTLALSALIEIEPAKRRYDDAERERLVELFGPAERWANTTGSLRWAQADVLVPGFTGSTRFELRIPCTYDLEVASAKYFAGLEGGEVPLRFHFNGTIMYEEEGRMQMVQVPWDRSTRFSMPLAAWRDLVAAHYPHRGWIPLHRETVDRLARLRAARALPDFDAAVRDLLEEHPGEGADAPGA